MAYFSHVCKDCTKRQLHCHSTCKEYLEAKEKHEAAAAAERKAKKAERECLAVAFLMKKG